MKICILFLALFFSQQHFTDHQGKWKGEENGDVGYLILDDEGFASLEINGQLIGGKSSVYMGKKVRMTYDINYESAPIELDLNVETLAAEELVGNLPGILEFLSPDKFRLALGFDGKRPTEFLEGDTMIFTREKK